MNITIIIPTFNRASYLQVLLERLSSEIYKFSLPFSLLVTDNCSSDNTASIVKAYLDKYEFITYIRQPSNIGSDANFLSAIRFCTTDYFWFIGDDDFPRSNVLFMVTELLKSSPFDLIYLPSFWSSNAVNISLPPITELNYTIVDVKLLSQRVHVWSSFVSGWIVNRNSLISSDYTYSMSEEAIGSDIIQVSWLFNLFRTGNKFAIFNDICLFATASNSGSYALINTFAIDFPFLIQKHIPSRKVRANLINGLCLKFLPKLILMRFASSYGNMLSEKISPRLIFASLGHYPFFWLFCFPLFFIPSSVLRLFSNSYLRIFR